MGKYQLSGGRYQTDDYQEYMNTLRKTGLFGQGFNKVSGESGGSLKRARVQQKKKEEQAKTKEKMYLQAFSKKYQTSKAKT